MKNIIIISLTILACSCKFNLNSNLSSGNLNSQKQSYYSDSIFHQNFDFTNEDNGEKTQLTCEFESSHIKSKTLGLNILLKYDNKTLKDTVNTKTFFKLIHLSKSDSIEIEGVDYALNNDEMTLKFIVVSRSLTNQSTDAVSKHYITYQTNIDTPKPKLILVKTELGTVEKKSDNDLAKSREIDMSAKYSTINDDYSKTIVLKRSFAGKQTQLNTQFNFSRLNPETPQLAIALNQNNTHFSHTIKTQQFAKLMELKGVLTMEIDSMNFEFVRTQLKVRFNLTAKYSKGKNAESKNTYSILYISDIQKKDSKLSLIKIQKNAIKINNTYTYNLN